MITGTIAVYSQIHYLKNKDLGFKSKNIVAVTIPPNQGDTLVSKKLRDLKTELKKEGYVHNATFTYNIPGKSPSRFVFKIKGKNGNIDKPIAVASSDSDFPSLMGMRLVKGRYLTDSIPSDETNAILVNEATVKLLGWKDPLSEAMYLPTADTANPELRLNVVGVLSDFHFSSLHSAIEPIVIFKNNPSFVAGYMVVEIEQGNKNNVVNNIQKKWKEIFPNKEFEYEYLEDALQQQYLAEDKLLQVFGYFAAVAIALTIMGLYGLSFFQTQQRTKEIGIRKVMGASSMKIISLVNKDFFILLFIGMLISIPVSYYCIGLWLDNFAYHTHFSVNMVVLSFVCITLVTFSTVSLQVSRTAIQNPVKSLRYE
jgi:putative ABC transport system permease protein